MTTVSQRSFASGELAPALYARVDTIKYGAGLRTMRNCYVMRHGGSISRSGTQFVCELADSTKRGRLVPFIFNNDQAYMLEFGELYVRVIVDGSQLTHLPRTITGVTNANPAVLTYTGTDPSNGDEVAISGIVGAIGQYLNGRNFLVASVNTVANTFALHYLDGTAVNSTTFGAYGSGGSYEKVYETDSPYYEPHLMELSIVQSADVMTIAHNLYYVSELVRNALTDWELSSTVYAASISAPSALMVSAGGTAEYYVITAVHNRTLEESLPSAPVGSAAAYAHIISNTGAATDVAYFNLYKQTAGVYGFIGTFAPGYNFLDPAPAPGITPDTTVLPPTDGVPFSIVTGVADIAITSISLASVGHLVSTTPHGFVEGELVFFHTFVGMPELEAMDVAIATNVTASAFDLYNYRGEPINTSAFTAFTSGKMLKIRNFPAVVSYYQERRVYANTRDNPETVWGTKTGVYTSFVKRFPVQDDGPVTFSMTGRQVNPVRHLLDLGLLVALTDSGEHSIRGNAAGVLTPSEVNRRQESYYGSSTLTPMIVGGSALFVQARGSVIRDLGFTFESEGYRGNDLTIFSAHLFDGYTIVDWAYQQNPHSIVWVVRDDGKLLSLTYVKEQQIVAWAEHDTDGLVENVSVVPEGNEDVVYLIVKRTIGGVAKRYVERLNTRQIDDIKDFVGMDSALTYDGRNTSAVTMALTEYSSGGWDYTSTITLTASSSFFSAAEVGNEIHLTGADGEVIRFVLDTYVSATVMRGRPNRTVPTSLHTTATATWSRAVDEITGLWHLEGKEVSIFADGFVVASPYNSDYPTYTVTNGKITLNHCYGVIHIGLPYLVDLETLDIDTAQGETLANKQKLVNHVTLHVEKTRGVFCGPTPPDDDDTDALQNLYEVRVRDATEGYEGPVEMQTGTVDVHIQAHWNSNGRVFMRQVDPVPMSILAVSLTGMIPFKR